MEEKPQLDTDLELLAAVRQQLTVSERKLRTYVFYARESGATWTQVAAALGISRRAAWKTYARLEERPLSDPAFAPLFLTPQVHDD